MGEQLDLLLLAVASAFWPLLIAVVVLALRTHRPVRILATFLAAALMTTVTEGLVIVAVLRRTEVVSSSRPTAGPAVDLTIGMLALVAAAVLRRRRHRPAHDERRRTPKRQPWTERAVQGGRLAFVAGIVLNLIPGVFPFVALKDIAEGEYGAGETVALVVAFYLIMFAFVEVPLLGYLLAPDRAVSATNRFNDWLDRNAQRLGVAALTVVGIFELVRGLLAIAG